MAVTRLSDLKLGADYYVCWDREPAFYNKVKFLGVINEYPSNTELYFMTPPQRWRKTHLCKASDIGIGDSKSEARKNYGRFKLEDVKSAYNSFEALKVETINYLRSPKASRDVKPISNRKLFHCILIGSHDDYYKIYIGYDNGDWNIIDLKMPLPDLLYDYHPSKEFFTTEEQQPYSEFVSPEEALKKLLNCTYDRKEGVIYPNEKTFSEVIKILKEESIL